MGRISVKGILLVGVVGCDGGEVELGDAAEGVEAAEIAGVGLGSDGGIALEELAGESFKGAGPVVTHGIGIRSSEQSFFSSDVGGELGVGVTDAAFELNFAGADAGEEDAADVFDIAVGSVERKLGIGGAVAFPSGGSDEAGLVVEEEAGVVGEEVDAVGAEVELQLADVDIFEALLAVLDGEGLAASFFFEPGADAGEEAAFFRSDAGLLPWFGSAGAEVGGEDGVDMGCEDRFELICSNSGDNIVTRADGDGFSGGKEALHDFVEERSLFGGADAPLIFVEGQGAEAL